MRALTTLTVIGFVLTAPSLVRSHDIISRGPLLTAEHQWQSMLPPDTHVLNDSVAIERFLDLLDGTPPDWPVLYGHGHQDSGLDDRLFALNRDRDAKREGKRALEWRVTFLWPGELSDYDQE